MSDTNLPDFTAEAVLSLTKKIKANLSRPPPEKKPKAQGLKPKKDKNQVKKSVERVPSTAGKAHKVTKGQHDANDHKPKPLSGRVVKQQQGKKRLRDGQAKGSDNSKSSPNRIKIGDKPGKKFQSIGLELEEEVLALGGTKEDYELVAGADSNSEMEGEDVEPSEGSRKSLGKDVLKFVRDLGIDKVDVKELEGSSELEQEENTLYQHKNLEPSQAFPRLESTEKSLPQKGKTSSTNGPSHLYFQPQSEWYSAVLPIPTPSQNYTSLKPDLIDRVHQHAKSLLALENTHYSSKNNCASSAHRFYSTIMSSGTLSDKISALTLSVQESPVHNMKALESLLGLARKRSRGQAVEVLGALKDLLGTGALLPSDRKLKIFSNQPGLSAVFSPKDTWTSEMALPAPLTECHLISWAYEDWLKSMYFDILKILETWCNDEVVFARSKAVDYVYQLLTEKPEQEANLLRLLVNKLGDTDKKIASKASYHVLQLENTHPLMKPTIITSVESDLLFRPGQSLHAKYYAVITLNQTILSGKEETVARKLLDIYFSLFVKLLERPTAEEKPTVTGVNLTVLNSKGEVQGGGGVPGKKAQRKMKSKEKGTTPDEELREKTLSAVLTGVNRAMPYTTTDDKSFEKHLDTLFRVTHSSNFNTSIQALMLIQQLSSSHPGSADRFYRTLYESLLDPRLLTSSKQTLYLNLLFKALKSDVNLKRVKAFSKRLLQIVAMHQASFACGTLYLLRELEGLFRGLQASIDEPQEDESDEEENFHDVLENASDNQSSFINNGQVNGGTRPPGTKSTYDGRKRDPEHSNAEKSCLWELPLFLLHFHPSVALFASKLTDHEPMPPKPDLSLHTLIHFLDRFVYKNPKLASKPRGASIMQPIAGGDTSGLLVSTHSKVTTREPVNSEAFWRKEADKVGADEVFFHKYFSTMGKGKEKAKKKKARKDEVGGEDEDDEDEDEIWKALVDSKPELDGGDPSDDELDASEFDSFSEDDGEDAGDLGHGGGAGWEDDVDDVDGTDMDEADGDDQMIELEEDDGAILDSDEELPSDLQDAFSKDQAQFGEKEPSLVPDESKRGKKRRKLLKNLPTFASADDYAALLDDDGE